MLDARNKEKAERRRAAAALKKRTIHTLLCHETDTVADILGPDNDDDDAYGTPPSQPAPSARHDAARPELGWLDADVCTALGPALDDARPHFIGPIEYLQAKLLAAHDDADTLLMAARHGRLSTAPVVVVVETLEPQRQAVLVDTGNAARSLDALINHANDAVRVQVRRVWPAQLHTWVGHLSPDGAAPYDKTHPALRTRISPDMAAPFFWDAELESALDAATRYKLSDRRTISRMVEQYVVRYFQLTRPNPDAVQQAVAERMQAQERLLAERRQELETEYGRRTARADRRLVKVECMLHERAAEEERRRNEEYARRLGELEQQRADHEHRRAALEQRADVLMDGYRARFDAAHQRLVARAQKDIAAAGARLAKHSMHLDAAADDTYARLAAYHRFLQEYHHTLVAGHDEAIAAHERSVPAPPPPYSATLPPPMDVPCAPSAVGASSSVCAATTSTMPRPSDDDGAPPPALFADGMSLAESDPSWPDVAAFV